MRASLIFFALLSNYGIHHHLTSLRYHSSENLGHPDSTYCQRCVLLQKNVYHINETLSNLPCYLYERLPCNYPKKSISRAFQPGFCSHCVFFWALLLCMQVSRNLPIHSFSI